MILSERLTTQFNILVYAVAINTLLLKLLFVCRRNDVVFDGQSGKFHGW